MEAHYPEEEEDISCHPVAHVVLQRRNRHSKPGNRTDRHKVGLAVEGGGMRGIVSGAMMAALADMGLRDSFDAVYSFSAGAINSAYFVSGAGWQALSIYYDDLVSKKFLDLRRLAGKSPVLSLDYAFNHVVEEINPLDYAAAMKSPIGLYIYASSVQEVRSMEYTGFRSKDELKKVLMASAALPLIADAPISYNGEDLLDGGVLLSHPLVKALSDGCTHVLVLRTRSDGYGEGRPSLGQRFIANRIDRYHEGLGRAFLETIKEYSIVADKARTASVDRSGPPYILDVSCGAQTHSVTRMTQDRGVLYGGIRAGYGALLGTLTGRTWPVHLRPAAPEFIAHWGSSI